MIVYSVRKNESNEIPRVFLEYKERWSALDAFSHFHRSLDEACLEVEGEDAEKWMASEE